MCSRTSNGNALRPRIRPHQQWHRHRNYIQYYTYASISHSGFFSDWNQPKEHKRKIRILKGRPRLRTCVNASAADPSVWRADASATCRCDCTWPDSTDTSSAARCANGSDASDWSPLCRSCGSATSCPDRVTA